MIEVQMGKRHFPIPTSFLIQQIRTEHGDEVTRRHSEVYQFVGRHGRNQELREKRLKLMVSGAG